MDEMIGPAQQSGQGWGQDLIPELAPKPVLFPVAWKHYTKHSLALSSKSFLSFWYSLFFCPRLSGLITPLVRIRVHWAENLVWSLDGPNEFFTKQSWGLYSITIGLPLRQKCERWAESVPDSVPSQKNIRKSRRWGRIKMSKWFKLTWLNKENSVCACVGGEFQKLFLIL